MTPPATRAPVTGELRNVFPQATLDHQAMPWEHYLHALTPITTGERVLYKREDAFAPLGLGGINGAKLRQLIHLIGGYRAAGGTRGVLTGASVLSPQNAMAACVAAHYGLPSLVILGGTTPASAARHENVAIAQAAGARLHIIRVGYNPALQREVTRLHEHGGYHDWYPLHYGIGTTPGAPGAALAAFHALGAAQVANLPARVRTLVMTLGSGYSAISVLLGIAQRRPAGLERVVLLGIGPNRLAFMDERLRQLGAHLGLDAAGYFTRRYHQHPELEAAHQQPGRVLLEHHDLHATGWATYGRRMRASADGIAFHPTYEGKAITWLGQHQPAWWAGARHDVLVWLVGGAATRHAMRAALPATATATAATATATGTATARVTA
jgi:hypothetical protein